jgi:hypothetical protein
LYTKNDMSSSARKLNLNRKSMTSIAIATLLISSAVTLSSFLGASALRESFPEDFKRIAHDVGFCQSILYACICHSSIP